MKATITPSTQEKPIIVLHQFPRAWGIPNPSQFCVKIETYLRLANLPYRSEAAIPSQAPLGKLPFILDDGKNICDSRLIVEYLKTTYGDPLDNWLSPEQKGDCHAILST